MSNLLSVEAALARVLAGVSPSPTEHVPLADAHGRTLAGELVATRTQPPSDLSAMDGYALRHADLEDVSQPLRLVGESAAGRGYGGTVAAGETVRIFTGAPLPEGADTVLVQEQAEVRDGLIFARERPKIGKNIRRAGLDFAAGQIMLRPGRRLGPAELALAAAMNHARVPVARRPRVALLATGDELVAPGDALGPDQIVASNNIAIGAYVAAAGGEVVDLGIVPDRLEALEAAILRARDAGVDVLVTLGGASVGDHDLVKPALARQGMSLDFWRIAMRPGKPLIHGRLGDMRILGLPGNPVSSVVCGILFLMPLIRALSGDPAAGTHHTVAALLAAPLPPNDLRQDYPRATLAPNPSGPPLATICASQDSSLLSVLASADCLIVRPPHAPAAEAGEICQVLVLPR